MSMLQRVARVRLSSIPPSGVSGRSAQLNLKFGTTRRVPTSHLASFQRHASSSNTPVNAVPFWAIFLACTASATLGVFIARASAPFQPKVEVKVGTIDQTGRSTPGTYASQDQTRKESLVYVTAEDIPKAITELRELLDDEKVSTDLDDLLNHGRSMNDYHPGSPHAVIVYPDSTEDVVKIVEVANKYRMPIVVYGGGTGLEGNFSADRPGSICVDMSTMDRILHINEPDADLICQPGTKWVDINATLEEKGIPLFFPLDPAPAASIGGMMSTGCSGTNAVRYGTAKSEWFLNATVVLPNGKVIKTRRRARKSSAGFDMTKLFIGAEGTLGIITEVTIRLAPLLPTTVAVVHFPSVQHATEAAREVLVKGVGIQCVELCDDDFMRSSNTYGVSLKKWPEKDSLFFKFQGHSPSSLADSARVASEVCAEHGGTGFTLAETEEEAHDLWQDRKNALYNGLSLRPGARGWSTDVCVPVSALPQLVQETKEDIRASGIVSTIVGHVGDGNFHALLLFDEDNPEEIKKCKDLVHRMVERALRLDGTCTGEHGVGVGKKEYLYEELGEGTVELMKTIKRTLDPYGLMNPGKLYPDGPYDNKSGKSHNGDSLATK